MPKKATTRTSSQDQKKRLREFYALGQEAIRRGESSSGTYAKGVSIELAEQEGLTRDDVDKARRCAEAYTKAEFTLFLASGLKYSHLIQLIFVDDKRTRKSLQRKAAEEGWSSRELQREIRERSGGKRSQGGRKPAAPRNLDQALNQIRDRCESWLKWQDMVVGEESAIDLPDDVAKGLRKASAAIRRLQAILSE